MDTCSTTPPIVLSPSLSGPHELYFDSPTITADVDVDQDPYYGGDTAGAGLPARMPLAPASMTDFVPVDHIDNTRHRLAPASPAAPALNTVRSNPALPASRPSGRVKDMANRIDHSQTPLTRGTSRDRYRRPATASRNAMQQPAASTTSSSETRKLQKRPRSPRKSPATSFDNSFSSATSSSTMRTSRSQPHAAFSPNRARSPNKQQRSRPLFGEITADGRWNGNFELGNYGPLPTFEKTRRGSEGSLALGHGRSQSHQDISTSLLGAPAKQKLQHKRSRSDMDAVKPQVMPSMPNLNIQNMPSLYPTPPDSATRPVRQKASPTTSRIPVSSRRQSTDSTASSTTYSRAASAMSNPPGRRRLDQSPNRSIPPRTQSPTLSRSRYHPPPISTAQPGQTLSAKIVAPPPKTSPPLRSSRPRQPVSSATTSASRARAAERFQGSNPGANARDKRRPSEQWLGKPYDPQKERSRRKIPELDKINFEERRARIQKAITQSLKSSDSQESMKRSQSRSASRSVSSRPPSRLTSHEHGQAAPGAEFATRHKLPQQQTEDSVPGAESSDGKPMETTNYSRGLSVETTGLLNPSEAEPEPLTAQTDRTMFEDDSPVLGRAGSESHGSAPARTTDGPGVLLTSATYQPPAAPGASNKGDETPSEEARSTSVLDNVMHMRHRSDESTTSRNGTEFGVDSLSAENSPSEIGDRWSLANGDQGSIRIMLDDDPHINHHSEPWSKGVGDRFQEEQHDIDPDLGGWQAEEYNDQAYSAKGFVESPVDEPDKFPEDSSEVTPRKTTTRDATLRPEIFQGEKHTETLDSDGGIARVLNYYQSTGTLTAEMYADMQDRMVDLHRISANGDSDANMIQSLLESIMDSRPPEDMESEKQMLDPNSYDIPTVTPDTPPMDDDFEPGTVIVYSNDTPAMKAPEEDDDFEAKIRKADEEWERQQRGEASFTDFDEESKPPPPPKDFGYTPRSSTGPISTSFLPGLGDGGLRISTPALSDFADVQAASDRVDISSTHQYHASPLAMSAPPLPAQPPPLPPPPGSKLPLTSPDVLSAPAFSERGSSELSPRVRKTNWPPSGSSRPSVDSQRVGPPIPASQSMTSFGDSTRQASFDTTADSQTRLVKTVSPGPEQKRLLKRRHIVRELLDTENSYHQDLKIIEDIYKATCTPELVAAEDKKVLFGNCDEVEKFALHFYDELRRAAVQVYVPAKQHRWASNKRSSFSTTQSDGTTQTSSDVVDDEKDRTTTVGRTFLMNLAGMEKVYGSYLKNHDAANQRLSAIQGTTTVKCWLDECHANASDITSAWDLDSLLVKPTQRVAKYPMLLKELLDSTPEDHPDHEDLKTASKDIIGMLTRINEAKKRADIVDQMINNKKGRKDSDLRGNISKAFGRRTEKLKERVGIAEAFQDPEFDEIAHKFGGHFIRLQICMRDVQDYVHRADKGIELVNNYVEALELFTDLHDLSRLAEIQSKWRRYGQIIRELTLIAFGDHKAAVQKRVLAPMIQCIKLHEGPQAAINKRKKKLVDYAKCQTEERRGQKPDKRTQESSDAYVALNETLKIELPQLYNLTAKLVQNCLHCFLDIQLKWHSTWEIKLRPVLEAADIPDSIQQIEPAFRPDFAEVEKSLAQLAICNGTLKLETANFLSPSTTLVEKSEQSTINKGRRPSTLDSSNRTLSVGSESSTTANSRRHSGIYNPASEVQPPPLDNRMRSNSAMSTRTPPANSHGSGLPANRPWSHSTTPTSSFSMSRPATANPPAGGYHTRQSSEAQRSPRPESSATYFTARPDLESHRFSGMFQSAYPPEVAAGTPHQQPPSPSRPVLEALNVLFVCASLFEFSIDRTRREAGYPYLQYVQGEVFDVVAQKGELWLAKNQDDPNSELGWIWEQHFIILSSD